MRPTKLRHSLHQPLSLLAAAGLFSLTAPLAAQDLSIQSVQFSQPVKAGNCNSVTVTIRNNSDQLINKITQAKVVIYDTQTGAFQNRTEKTLSFSAVSPNGTRYATAQGVDFAAGETGYTVQVVADSGNVVAETNENNNVDNSTVNVSDSCGGGLCDLEGRSVRVYGRGTSRRVTASFRNVGGAQCDQSSIQIKRWVGSSTNGQATMIATKTITASQPNQNRTVTVQDSQAPTSGTHTYGFEWVGSPPDQNTANNFASQTVTFDRPTRPPGGGGGRPTNPSGCDLRADFVSPSGTSMQGGRPASYQVKFKNQGNAACIGNKIKLNRYNNSSCSGYGSSIGGSGGFATLNPLQPGAEQTLTWSERSAPRKGKVCLKMSYSPAFNDDNNGNHHPKKQVTYQ